MPTEMIDRVAAMISTCGPGSSADKYLDNFGGDGPNDR